MPPGPVDSNQPATDTPVTIERVSKSRRALSKTLAALPALASLSSRAQNTHATRDTPAAAQKVLRYAFRVAETGFDPAQVNDLYSSTVIANIFDAPLTYDFLARPAKIVPNTAVALPEVSDDFRTLTLRIRPGIFFQDHAAFNGRKRELVAQDYVYSIKRIYDPKLKSPRVYLLENAKLLGMNEVRAAALKGAAFDIDRAVDGRARARPLHVPARGSVNRARVSTFTSQTTRSSARSRARSPSCTTTRNSSAIRSAPGRSVWSTGVARRAWCSSATPATATSLRPAAGGRRHHRRGDGGAAARPQAAAGGSRRGLHRRGEPAALARLPEHASTTSSTNCRTTSRTSSSRTASSHPTCSGARSRWTARRAPTSTWRSSTWSIRSSAATRAEKVALRRAIGLAYAAGDEIRLVRKGQSIPSQSPVAAAHGGLRPRCSGAR